MQLGEKHRLAVEAEAPGEGGDAEADEDNGPALAEFARLRFDGACSDSVHVLGSDARLVLAWMCCALRLADKRFFMAGSIEIFYPDRHARSPPLNALRAFEASARHLSMKEAAAELSVTPGAVSQLVRGLEQRLGTQLFRRGNRSLVLTEAGQNYFAPIRHAFRQIGEATRRLRALPHAGVLTVSAPPAFAASWLVPRLGRSARGMPISSSTSPPRVVWRISPPMAWMWRSAMVSAAIPACAATASPASP